MSGIVVPVLFAVFAACILFVLLTGADSYQTLTKRDQSSYDRRTAAQYITTKIRQNDIGGMVFVGDFDTALPDVQGNTLSLTEAAAGGEYCTRLYCHDGYIRELFAIPAGGFSPEDGEKILPAQSLSFSMENGFVTVELAYSDAVTEQFVLALRSTEVGS